MPRQLKLRVSLAGLTHHASGCIEALATKLREAVGWKVGDDEREDDPERDPAGEADYYAFGLAEVSRHARETADDEHTVDEFADFYCLARDMRPLVLTETDYSLEG
jgi:hypothetical protein